MQNATISPFQNRLMPPVVWLSKSITVRDSRLWQMRPPPWDRENTAETMSLMVAPWELRGLHARLFHLQLPVCDYYFNLLIVTTIYHQQIILYVVPSLVPSLAGSLFGSYLNISISIVAKSVDFSHSVVATNILGTIFVYFLVLGLLHGAIDFKRVAKSRCRGCWSRYHQMITSCHIACRSDCSFETLPHQEVCSSVG